MQNKKRLGLELNNKQLRKLLRKYKKKPNEKNFKKIRKILKIN